MKDLTTYFEPVVDSIMDLPIINEHLKSLDVKDVIRTLNKKFAHGKFPFKLEATSNSTDKNPMIQIFTMDSQRKWLDDVTNELDLMMWTISKEWCEGGLWKLQLEPNMSTSCNKYVYQECGGILFHPTPRASVESILSGGLRMHEYKSDKRNHVHRCYFVVGKNSTDRRNAIRALMKDDLEILKIDLNEYGRNLEFYHDPAYRLQNMVYVYSNIPGALITHIQFNDI